MHNKVCRLSVNDKNVGYFLLLESSFFNDSIDSFFKQFFQTASDVCGILHVLQMYNAKRMSPLHINKFKGRFLQSLK